MTGLLAYFADSRTDPENIAEPIAISELCTGT